jgi:hypothetical protein
VSFARPYCPIHEFELRRCSLSCRDARIAFRASAQALRVYWHHRLKVHRNPMSLAEYRVRFGLRIA